MDPKEYVISFRSTEAVDDAIRDSSSTNTLEIHETGWAWGQIADMEKWYADLKASGAIPKGQKVDVTGYSLGGHLATTFNLLHHDEIGVVITFNGAGVGEIKAGHTREDLFGYFADLLYGGQETVAEWSGAPYPELKPDIERIKRDLGFDPNGSEAYQKVLSDFLDELYLNLEKDLWTAEEGLYRLIELRNELEKEYHGEYYEKPVFSATLLLEEALRDIVALQREAARIEEFKSGDDKDPSPLRPVDADKIIAENLYYQARRILFSGKEDDTFEGGSLEDHLYGGADDGFHNAWRLAA
jgi:hypothetical protein